MLKPLLPALLALALASPVHAQDAGAFVGFIFDRIDRDDDGLVSVAEMNRARAGQFDRVDRDGDGEVTRAEAERIGRRIRRGAAQLEGGLDAAFDRFDANGDGAVSRQEYLSRDPAWMRLFDVDDDGALSRAEVDRGLAILRDMRG